MEVKIEIKCKCGNSDVALIRQGKEFSDYDIFTTELVIQESITDSGRFESNQTNPEDFYIKCTKCGEEITLI